MKKIKLKWYIIFLIICIVSYSVICCFYFGRNLYASFPEKLSTVQTTREADNPLINKFMNSNQKISSVSEIVKSIWDDSVYNKKLFSTIDTLVSYYSIGEISSTQVLQGKTKFLFYKSQTDGNPIGDYEGTNYHSESELKQMADKAQLVQDTLKSKGIDFTIMIAPNKENVYAEDMSEEYLHSETSRSDLMITYLKNHNINVADPKKELLRYHNDYQLYYHYDTHWNQLGGFIGSKISLEHLGIALPKLSDMSITSPSLAKNRDLAAMIGLEDFFNDDSEYEIGENNSADRAQGRIEQMDDQNVLYISSPKAPFDRTLFLVGDSFRNAMIPTLKNVFKTVYVVHNNDYQASMIDTIQPDYLIYECVERYSGNISNIDHLIH